EGVLEVHPGTGTAVAARPPSSPRERAQLLGQEIEQLVVEAKRCGVDLDSVLAAVQKHWKRLGGRNEPHVSLSKEEERTSVCRGVKNRLDGHKFAKLPHKTTVFEIGRAS